MEKLSLKKELRQVISAFGPDSRAAFVTASLGCDAYKGIYIIG